MTLLQCFLSEFWPIFIFSSILLPALSLGRVWSLNGHLPFIRAKCFGELSEFAEEQQQQLLHDTSKEASRRWPSLLPFLLFAGTFSAGEAIGYTLPKFTAAPDSFWVHLGFSTLFAVFGFSLAARFEVRQLRPFLRISIAKARHAA